MDNSRGLAVLLYLPESSEFPADMEERWDELRAYASAVASAPESVSPRTPRLLWVVARCDSGRVGRVAAGFGGLTASDIHDAVATSGVDDDIASIH